MLMLAKLLILWSIYNNTLYIFKPEYVKFALIQFSDNSSWLNMTPSTLNYNIPVFKKEVSNELNKFKIRFCYQKYVQETNWEYIYNNNCTLKPENYTYEIVLTVIVSLAAIINLIIYFYFYCKR